MPRPVIAVLMDYEAEGSFSARPHYALRIAYFNAIECAGGTPVAVPYLPGSMDSFLDLAGGVVLPGGFFPFPKHYYGEAPDPNEAIHPRVAFEESFTRTVLDRDVPLLGICAGLQVMGGVMGATMHRDLHDVIDTDIDHLNEKPAEETAHDIAITPGTLLHDITGLDTIGVNTAHREAIDTVPDTVTVNATAPDGTIEGIEIPSKRFALGVQWHPEFFLEHGSPHLALFEALVKSAANR